MVTTLPITLRADSPIGYWLTPVVADILAKRSRNSLTIHLGQLGMRERSASKAEDYKKGLNNLNIAATVTSDHAIREALFALTEQALKKALTNNNIRSSKCECYVCDCGALEMPIQLITHLKPKTFTKQSDTVSCSKCSQVATIRTIQRSTLHVDPETMHTVLAEVSVTPTFYEKDMKDLAEQILAHGIPFTKNRATGFEFNDMAIDVELVWQSLLAYYSTESLALVVNNHVLRQTLITLILSKLAGASHKVKLLVLPYISHPGKADKWSINKLLALGHDHRTIRYMLAASLSWDKKDNLLEDSIAQVEYRRLNLLQQRIAASSTEQRSEDVDLQKFVMSINRNNCRLGLKNVFHPEVYQYANLIGL